jgi:hypothetical protein
MLACGALDELASGCATTRTKRSIAFQRNISADIAFNCDAIQERTFLCGT